MAEKILEWASDPNVVLAAASLGTSFVQTRHGIKQDKELHEKETFQNSILSSVALKEQLDLHRASIEQAHAHHLSSWNQALWLHRRETIRSNHVDRVNACMELLHNEREAEHDQCESYASTLQTHIVSSRFFWVVYSSSWWSRFPITRILVILSKSCLLRSA